MNAIGGHVRLSAAAKADLRLGRPAMSPRRRSMIGKVHAQKKELGLIEDDYRQILRDVTRRGSCVDCTDAELVKLLDYFKSIGAKSTRKGPRPADHPGAGKARAMWISLHQLGAIDDARESALEAFAARQLKCARLQWADQSHMDGLIEGLKAIAQRNGWDQSIAGVPVANRVLVLKRRLVERQLARLVASDWAPADWTVARAAFEFGGVEIAGLSSASLTQLDDAARALGGAVNAAKQAGQLK